MLALQKDRIVSSAICTNTHPGYEETGNKRGLGVQGDRQRVGRVWPRVGELIPSSSESRCLGDEVQYHITHG